MSFAPIRIKHVGLFLVIGVAGCGSQEAGGEPVSMVRGALNQSSPKAFRFLERSERAPLPGATALGTTSPSQSVTVTLIVRRRPGGGVLPSHEDWMREPPGKRRFPSADEFARNHGASAEDLELVTGFALANGLSVIEADSARRSVIVSGTAAQMNAAFGVTLADYEAPAPQRGGHRHRPGGPLKQIHRGFSGKVSLPSAVADVVEGVFGLDNRRTGGANYGDPPNTVSLAISEVQSLYNFPTNSAAGQTIGVVDMGEGYIPEDISAYYTMLGSSYQAPVIQFVSVDGGANQGIADETEQDIETASTVAQGATIAVYSPGDEGTEQAWVDVLNRAIHPGAGDPVPSVITSSWYIGNADDSVSLPSTLMDAVSSEFQDAAALGVTVFIAAGDSGSASKITDGNAHVQYPGSDPWVTSVGGTTIGDVSGSSFSEIVWNDEWAPGSWVAATGGGVSDYFAVPAWQTNAGVSPTSVNDNQVRRGVPDIAGNASANSGFPTVVNGQPWTFGGTSQTAPFYAGLAATINAAINTRIGFLNPTLYSQGATIFRDITSGDNQWQASPSTPYYTAGIGWDGCSGLGVVNGNVLLSVLKEVWVAEIIGLLPTG